MEDKELYRNAIENLRHQENLLFNRLNYFLAGSAFMVTAYAALAVGIKHWAPSQSIVLLTYLVNGAGFYLAIFFSVINYLNIKIIEALSEQIIKWQKGYETHQFQKWTDSSEIIRTEVVEKEFHNDVFRMISGPVQGLAKFVSEPFHPAVAPYTYILPLCLAIFWVIVFSFVFHPPGLENLYFFSPFLLVIVHYIVKFCSWTRHRKEKRQDQPVDVNANIEDWKTD